MLPFNEIDRQEMVVRHYWVGGVGAGAWIPNITLEGDYFVESLQVIGPETDLFLPNINTPAWLIKATAEIYLARFRLTINDVQEIGAYQMPAVALPVIPFGIRCQRFLWEFNEEMNPPAVTAQGSAMIICRYFHMRDYKGGTL